MMQASTEQRDRNERIDLAADVRILTAGQSNTIQASTQNISESGMFVVTEALCSVNAELECDVSLPSLTLPVRGRVVWVQTEPRPGMGIAFLDLSEADLDALREVVEEQGASLSGGRPGQPVKVWMEALPQPIRAEAVQTAEGVLLRSELSFLRLASPVLVYPAEAQNDEESYAGVLQDVSLTMNAEGSAPVLLLHMHFAQREEDVPLTVADEPRDRPDRICTPVEPEPLPELEALDDEPKVVLCDPELDDDERSWELGLETDPCARSYWTLEGPEEPEVRLGRASARKGHPWLWAAALLMAGLAVASMAYTDLFPRARQQALIWLAYAGLAEPASAPAEPVLTTNDLDLATPAPPPAADAPPVSGAPEAASAAAPAEQVVPVSEPGNYKIVTSEQGNKELVVLLKGSTKEAKSYRLGNPDGVAFNLPAARPQERYRSHQLDRSSAFRRVQVRPRAGGTQVRVLFWGSAPPYKVKVLPRQIRLTLLPDQRQAAGPSTPAM